MSRSLKSAFFICSIFLSLLLVEVFFRYYFSSFQGYDIEMWRYASGFKRSVADERSHVHKPNVRGNLMGVPVSINSNGLRDEEYQYEKPEGVYRILVIGDSLTFGWGVNAEDIFSEILEKKLNERNDIHRKYKKIEVINGGIGNYNTRQESAFLEKEGLKYLPDEVILAHFINDAEKTQREVDNFFTRGWMTYAHVVSVKNKVFSAMDESKRYDAYYNNLYEGENFKEYEGVIDGFEGVLKENQIKLTVLILPEFHDFHNYAFSGVHDKIKNLFLKRGYPAFDALEVFYGSDAKDFWVAGDDPHPNATAHGIIADYLFEKIGNNF